MAAKRKRDYKAEERRRNELARERGYRNRAQQRRAIEKGEMSPLDPERVRSPKTVSAQAKRLFQTNDFIRLTSALDPRDMAQDWSGIFARSEQAEYNPERAAELGVSEREYTRAYLDAFVLGDDRYEINRRSGSDPLFYWFVTLNGFMSADTYDKRYGPSLTEGDDMEGDFFEDATS